MENTNFLSYTVKKNILVAGNTLETNQQVNVCTSSAVSNSGLKELSANNSDTILVNGKEMSLLSEVSDERLNAVYSDIVKIPEITITMSTTYKNFSIAEVSRIKQLIYNLHNNMSPGKPSEPEPETPSEPEPENPTEPTDPSGPEAPTTINHSLIRKDTTQNAKTITIPATGEVTLELKNSVDGKTYYYTLSSNSGAAVSADLEYWDNGRFVICGNGIKVVATKEQDDNIILIGNNCYLNANSGNDIIRIGAACDSNFDKATESEYNEIYTGAGDDYILSYGYENPIDAGSGNDVVRAVGFSTTGNTGSYFKTKLSGVEFYFSDRDEYLGNVNHKLDGSSQGRYGDCKFLSFLNSLNKDLSDYVSITKSGNNYVVKFKNCTNGYGTQTITSADLSGTMNADGDIDLVLIEIAFRKAIDAFGKYNIDNDPTGDPAHDDYMLGYAVNNFLISEFFFGSSDAGCYYLFQESIPNFFNVLLSAYLEGKISHLVLGTHDAGDPEKGIEPSGEQNLALGIGYNHAYAVKGGVVGQYVILNNPWDSLDEIYLDWNDLYKYFNTLNAFGDTYTYLNDRSNFSGFSGTDNDGIQNYEIEISETVQMAQDIIDNEKLEKTNIEFLS